MPEAVLSLVPFAPEHFATLASWFASERDVVQWGGSALRFPLDAPQMQVMLDESRSEPPGRLCWMARGPEGDFSGHAQIGIDWRHGNALIGRFGIAPASRGRGLATPLMRLVLAQAFAIDAVERVELNVYAFNTPAIRIYEATGFRREGVRRSCTQVGDERWDAVMMSQLRSEYRPAG